MTAWDWVLIFWLASVFVVDFVLKPRSGKSRGER